MDGPRRIVIFGGSGAGKSWLAREVGARLGLPVVHMDRLFWTEGWVQRPKDQLARLVAAAAAGEDWVFEGNNAGTFPLRAVRADLIVFLDLPAPLRLLRVLRRVAGSLGRVRADMAPGCPERFDPGFLLWTLRWSRLYRAKMLALVPRGPDAPRFLRLTSATAVTAFLAGLPRA